jgi:EAL domain-containing protein (putative c-di-GMP-specific phosphodiesterase class I)
MHSSAVARLDTHGRLHRALRRGELVLHWQPQVDLDTGELVGLEALARWEDPERGLVPPSEFVPVAEASGLIEDLGVWVVHEACRQMAEWGFVDIEAPPRISVNVSPRQLDGDGIVRAVEEATSAYAIDPTLLTLELTETVMPGREQRAAATARELCALGCVLSLDDFGTGYASLGVLTELPLQQLKIDRTFVTGMLQHESRRRIVGAVAQLCRSLGFEAIAEGIENFEELTYLRGIGCRIGQGYLISRPQPAAAAAPWLTSPNPFGAIAPALSGS